MGLLDDLKHAAEKVKDAFESVEDELQRDMHKIVHELEDDWNDFASKVKELLDEIGKTEDDLYTRAKSYFDQDMGELGITSLIDSVKDDLTTLKNDVSNIENNIKAIANDGAKQSSDEFKYLEDSYFKPIGAKIWDAIKTFDAVSVGLTEEISGVLGESEILSVGYKFHGDSDVRICSTTGISFGAEEGAEVGAFLGVWTKGPKNLKGAFFSLDLELDAYVGVGLKVYLDLLALAEYMLDEGIGKKNDDWGFRGVILLATVGEAAEASGEVSANMTFRIPG
jgi:ElaB/YqjD/DUF883 family membrane-anchored ribosome-binding protein